MIRSTDEKLARSLTAEDTGLIPYLPYLLQDLWSLGSEPLDIEKIIEKNIPQPRGMRVLDLAAGKGGVGIPLARRFGMRVHMVDILPEFIDYARRRAAEQGVKELCSFAVEDINLTVAKSRGWDCAMLLGAGDVLGGPEQTVTALARTVGIGGYVLLEDSYAGMEDSKDVLCAYDYPREQEWDAAFGAAGLTLIEKFTGSGEALAAVNDMSNEAVSRRAAELSVRYPDRKGLFDGYVMSQLNESADLENSVESAIWLLRRDD